jgi:hypothetical protein
LAQKARRISKKPSTYTYLLKGRRKRDDEEWENGAFSTHNH